MLTKTTFHYLNSTAKIASDLGAIPFEWDGDSKAHPFRITTLSVRKFVVYCCIQHVYMLYLFARLVEFSLTMSSETFQQVCLTFSMWATMLFVHLHSVNLYFKRTQYRNFFNSWFAYFFYFKETYVVAWHAKRGWKNGCEKSMRLLKWLSNFMILMMTAHYLDFPDNPIYMITLISKPGTILHEITYLPWGVLVVFAMFTTMQTMLTLCYITGIPAYVIRSIHPELKPRLGEGGVYRTKKHLRMPENMVTTYRYFYLLSMMSANLMAVIGLPCQYLSSYTVIACNLCLLKYGDQLEWKIAIVLFAISVLFSVAWTCMLWLSAMTFRSSLGILSSWKIVTNTLGKKHMLMGKMRESCRPIKIRHGGLYYITVRKVMQYVNFLIWGTVRSLLMFNMH